MQTCRVKDGLVADLESHCHWGQLVEVVCPLHQEQFCIHPWGLRYAGGLYRIEGKFDLLQLVFHGVKVVRNSRHWYGQICTKHSNGIFAPVWYICVYVCVCVYHSANLGRAACKEILHQCRPDYRSEHDQCQNVRSRVMRPNSKTGHSLMVMNRQCKPKAGRWGGWGNRDQTGKEGRTDSVQQRKVHIQVT